MWPFSKSRDKKRIEALEADIEKLKETVEGLNEECRRAVRICVNGQKLVDDKLTAVYNIMKEVNVAVDIHETERGQRENWAVISVRGNGNDFVKFVDLGHCNPREIRDFIGFFNRKSVNIDLPPAYLPKDRFFRFD